MAEGIEELTSKLASHDSRTRRRAAEALGKTGDSRAVEPLIRALSDSDPHVCQHAATALGEIGDRRAIEPLIRALAGNPGDSRRKSRRVLVSIPVALIPQNVRHCATEALQKIGMPAVEPLIRALADPDSDIRWGAAAALGRIRDQRAVAPLITALTDTDTGVCRIAVYALGEIGDVRAIEPLSAAMTHSDSYDRWNAAMALSKIKDPRTVEPLCRALTDGSEQVRRTAASALHWMGGPELPRSIAVSEMPMQLRISTLHALRDSEHYRHYVPTLPQLCEQLKKDADPAARLAAREMLAYQDNKLVIAAALPPDSSREQLLRMPQGAPADTSGGELIRGSSAPTGEEGVKPGKRGLIARLRGWFR